MNQMESEYALMVARLAKPGWQVSADLTADSAHLLHMAIGICGEAGELMDAIKKHAIYVKPLDEINVIEELGDLEFYMEGIRQAINVSREEVLSRNVSKLAQRYAKAGYSNEAAQQRADKEQGK